MIPNPEMWLRDLVDYRPDNRTWYARRRWRYLRWVVLAIAAITASIIWRLGWIAW